MDKTVDILEWQTGKIIHSFSSRPVIITSVALSSDNQKIAIGKFRGGIAIWDIVTKNESTLFQSSVCISNLKFTQDNKHLLSTGCNNKIMLHYLVDNRVELEFPTLATIPSAGQGADLSPDGTLIVVSTTDGLAKIYDLQGNLQHVLIIGKQAGEWISYNYTTNNGLKNIPLITWELFLYYKTVILFILILFGFLIAFLRLRFFKHPIVVQLSQYPETLFNLPLQQLNETKKLLQVTRRLEMVLGANQIAVHTFKTAARFSQLKPLQRAEQLANRVSARIDSHDADFYLIKLPKLFPLNIEECYLYFPNEKDMTVDIIEKLTLSPKFQQYKIIIITTNVEQQQGLQRYAQDIHNEVVVPDAHCLARWLLSPEATQTVSKLMASQLNLSYLSPYHNRGSGVDKDTAFFGRTHIISQIIGRNPQNYIIVGGRRIGKTSLLKYLYRYYEEKQMLNVYYFDATDSDLQRLLIDKLRLTRNSTFDDIVEYLRQQQKTALFLIDEVDVFIKKDEQRAYHNLNKLRALSAEGHCYFILAGFWHLYQASVFEYHNPLRNFGELFELGILEREACRHLVIRPLSFMNITIADELVERIVQQLGQRADLIAQMCHLLIVSMDITIRTINELMVENTFQHQSISNALYGWQTLAPTEAEQALDCMIMNVMVTEEFFSLGRVFAQLAKKNGEQYPLESIKKSLQRLVLCCVLKINAGQYSYTIPLLKEKLIFESMETNY